MEETWKFLPRSIELLLVVGLAWFVSGWFVGKTRQEPVVAVQVIDQKSGKMIIDAALFGISPLLSHAAKKVVENPVIKSHLQLKLIGTILAGERSAAILMLGNANKQQLVLQGKVIESGVTLKKVEISAIVVNNHGRLERIVLMKAQGDLKEYSGSMNKKPLKAVSTVLSRKYISKQTHNFSKLLSQARALPHIKNGKMDGFVLSEIVPGSLYQSIGLQNGDVLLKVNGLKITGAKQAMEMYQKLQTASVIDLELIRAGAMMPLHYEIR